MSKQSRENQSKGLVRVGGRPCLECKTYVNEAVLSNNNNDDDDDDMMIM